MMECWRAAVTQHKLTGSCVVFIVEIHPPLVQEVTCRKKNKTITGEVKNE